MITSTEMLIHTGVSPAHRKICTPVVSTTGEDVKSAPVLIGIPLAKSSECAGDK